MPKNFKVTTNMPPLPEGEGSSMLNFFDQENADINLFNLVDDELIKINIFSDNAVYNFKDNHRYTIVKKNYVDEKM